MGQYWGAGTPDAALGSVFPITSLLMPTSKDEQDVFAADLLLFSFPLLWILAVTQPLGLLPLP